MSLEEGKYTLYCQYYDELEIDNSVAFFESHNSMDFAGNMLYIAKEISENESYNYLKIVISCTIESKTLIKKIADKYLCANYSFVLRESAEYFQTLATAKYLFTDVAYYSLFRKKRGQICISTWHGTPLKTLGFSFFEDSYVVANQKRGFLLADYFVCPNYYTWECIRKSYQLEGLFKGKVVFGGYPRNSIFFDSKRRKELKEKLAVGEKKIVVYMPTWRGRVIEVNGEEQSQRLQQILQELDFKLPEGYEMWVKLHRLNQNQLDFSEFTNIIPFPRDYETYDVLNIADVLVTDYSSVMFDFSVTRKKVVLYCYDKEDYINNRKCYFDIDRVPFPIVEDIDKLIEEICSPKKYEDDKFVQYFCENDNANASKNIVNTVISNRNNCEYKIIKREKDKKNIVFVGELNECNATDALFDYLQNNKSKKNYITYLNHLFKNKGYKLMQFGALNQIPFYAYGNRYSYYTQTESKVMKNIRQRLSQGLQVSDNEWKVQESISNREYERFMYQNSFQTYIRFAGLDLESLKLFRVFEHNKIIYVHDNMVQKACVNFEYYTYLKRAIEVATQVHFANKDIFKQYEDLNGKLDGKIIVENLY